MVHQRRRLLPALASLVAACRCSFFGVSGQGVVGALFRPLEEAVGMQLRRRPVYPLLTNGDRGIGSDLLSAVQLPDLSVRDSSRTLDLLSSMLPQLSNEVLKDLNFDVEDFSSLVESPASDALDQALINAFGPAGSTHLPSSNTSLSEVQSGSATTSSNPRLRELNDALSLHGYPPLPRLPRLLKESASSRETPSDHSTATSSNAASEELKVQTFEQLIEWVNSGKGLPAHVLAEFATEAHADFYKSWLLPSTRMPSLNPGLAKSPWPTPHRTGFSQLQLLLAFCRSFLQASSPLPAPDGSRKLTHQTLNRALITTNPITLFYSADERFLWGSSWTTVFKASRNKTGLEVIDFVAKPHETIWEDKFHGAYSLLTEEEVLLVSSGPRLEAYYDVPDTDGQRITKHSESFDLNSAFPEDSAFPSQSGEVIRALCVTGDGHVAWDEEVASAQVTNVGRVGILSRDVKGGAFRKVLSSVFLAASLRPGASNVTEKTLTAEGLRETNEESVPETETNTSSQEPFLEVSNNIACDEKGGIFVVSSKFLHRVQWNGSRLSVVWETAYDETPFQAGSSTALVRLGAGSGSTPTLMGPPDHRFVVITDSAKIMNIVVFDAETGAVQDRQPITFGDASAESTSSEQSVLVHGWRMVVVNNEPSDKAKRSARLLRLFGFPASWLLQLGSAPGQTSAATGSAVSSRSAVRASEALDILHSAMPVLVGDAPRGVVQFEFDPTTRTLRRTWVNSTVSIPNGIPTMSAKTSLLYGVGKRSVAGGAASPMRGMWSLEALDWWTGESRFHYNIGVGPMTNSVYAATQVGPGEIVTGTAGGVIRILEI